MPAPACSAPTPISPASRPNFALDLEGFSPLDGELSAYEPPAALAHAIYLPMQRRLAGELALAADGDAFRDAVGMAVENFGLPLNLMRASSAHCYETREAAVAALVAFLYPVAP